MQILFIALVCVDGARILRVSEVSKVVQRKFRDVKGAGARALNYRLKDDFVGMSERRILEVLSKDHLNQ